MNKRKTASMGYILKLVLIVSLILNIIVVFYLINTSNTVMRNQTAKLNNSFLKYYMVELDTELNNIENFFYNTMSANDNVYLLEQKVDEDILYFPKVKIEAILSQAVSLSNYNLPLNGAFFYSPDGTEAEYVSYAPQYKNFDKPMKIKYNIIKNISENTFETNDWYITKIEDKAYLFRVIKIGVSYCGAWIEMDSLTQKLDALGLGEKGQVLLASSQGEPYTNRMKLPQTLELISGDWKEYVDSNTKESYLQTNVASSASQLNLVSMTPFSSLGKDVKTLSYAIIFACFIMLLLPLCMALVNTSVYRPIGILVKKMALVGRGNLDVSISKPSRFEEFESVRLMFNKMVQDIRTLKIDAYEQKISEQKIKGQFLQIQVESHFFINSLNIVYMLAQMRDHVSIEKLSLYMVRYFRYLSEDAYALVSIAQEIEHIHNYIEIQKMRFINKIDFKVFCDKQVEEYLVPALVIQTFVENSIKYGAGESRRFMIGVEVKKVFGGANINITDRGKGYSTEFLEQINNSNEDIVLKGSGGVGINNIKNRLRLFFGDKASIKFYNNKQGGAGVAVFIPEKREDGKCIE